MGLVFGGGTCFSTKSRQVHGALYECRSSKGCSVSIRSRRSHRFFLNVQKISAAERTEIVRNEMPGGPFSQGRSYCTTGTSPVDLSTGEWNGEAVQCRWRGWFAGEEMH